MTLDQWQIFIAVAEREHITRAADALGLAPPSVSAAVASLEREFGTKLFHRVGRGIAVTEGGKLLLGEARDLVNRAEAVKLAMREFTGLARGRLAIKASQTIASHFLPSRLVDFHQAHPGVALVVSIGNSTEVVEAIIRGDIELGFVEGPTAARAAERWSFAERCQSKLTSSLATPLATELRKRLALQH